MSTAMRHPAHDSASYDESFTNIATRILVLGEIGPWFLVP